MNVLRSSSSMRPAGRLGRASSVSLLAWLVTAPLSAFLVSGVIPVIRWSSPAPPGCSMLASLAAVWGPVTRAMGIAPGKVLKAE